MSLFEHKNETRVINVCKEHGYSGLGSKTKPEYGCKMCNEITFFTILAHKSKDGKLDLGTLDLLEAYIHALCELEDEGKFDWAIKEPEINIEKGKD